MVTKTVDYKDILIEKYEAMRVREPGFSLRRFAQAIGLTPSNLSDIFKGRCGLSVRGAAKIARSLEMDEVESRHFLDLVESRHARSQAQREAAAKRLEERELRPFTDIVTREELPVISKWYFLAALELVTVTKGEIDESDLSRRLSISVDEARETFFMLMRLNLISAVDGKWVRTKNHLVAESPVPSDIIRQYHHQILELAGNALFEQPMPERKFSTTMLTFDSKRMEEVRTFLNEMNDEFFRRFEAQTTGDSVRVFSFQFFRVDDGKGTN